MSSNQSRGGRGAGQRGGGDRGGRGRDDAARGGRGDFQGGGRGRGDSQGGRGDFQGGRGRGDFPGGRGTGPPGRGQSTQMPVRGARGGGGAGGIYLATIPVTPPDPEITAAEDALAVETKGKIIEGLPGRPGYGTKGKAIVLRTNYFKITTAYEANTEEMTLFRYEIAITGPPGKTGSNDKQSSISKQKRRRLLDQLFTHPAFATISWACDFAAILVTTAKLDLAKLMGSDQELRITLAAANGAGQQQPPQQAVQAPDFVKQARDRNTFKIAIRFRTEYNPRQLIEYLRSSSSGAVYAGCADMIQMLNIIATKTVNSANNVQNVGQNKFYPFGAHPGKEFHNLGGGLEALRGYFSSVRPTISRLLININVTAGAFFKPLYLRDMLREVGSSYPQVEAFIRMLKVETRYIKDGQQQPFMKKVKTIIGFAKHVKGASPVKRFGNASEVKFSYVDTAIPNAAPRQVTVAEYFKRQHGISLKAPELPVLNVGTPNDPQYLPVELCWVTPGQAYRRLLSGGQTSEMLLFAARFPNLNAMSIAGVANSPGNGLRLLRLADPSGDPQTTSVGPFGFRIGTDMISVPGRVLPPPSIKYGQKTLSTRNGSWNLAETKFARPGKFVQWQALVINRQGNYGNALRSNAEQTISALEKSLTGYGITMGKRLPTRTITLDQLTMHNRQTNDRQLKGEFQKAEDARVNMLFIIIPENDRWLYARIKYFGDVEHGIGTICSVGSKLEKEKGQPMYFGNLALKFNLKGGGVSHSVANTITGPIDNNTMLVGIDVTHPSPGSAEGAPSIACVVASIDSQMFQWPGSIRSQKSKQEMVGGNDEQGVDHLEEMFNERLNLWLKHNKNRLPSKIVIYRDGVSEGQYSLVLQHELPSFEKVFEKRYGKKDKWPKVAIIIVGKRHHTRFYPTRQEDADCHGSRPSWNPLPGTVVDRGVVGKIVREFYLQAHQGLQGTARPAHYVVIKDDILFTADALEQFTHHLCYLFNRATKAVSICPPAYYADLLCERGRSYLFSALGENHASDSSAFDGSAEWTGGVHARIRETTWYV